MLVSAKWVPDTLVRGTSVSPSSPCTSVHHADQQAQMDKPGFHYYVILEMRNNTITSEWKYFMKVMTKSYLMVGVIKVGPAVLNLSGGGVYNPKVTRLTHLLTFASLFSGWLNVSFCTGNSFCAVNTQDRYCRSCITCSQHPPWHFCPKRHEPDKGL